VDQSEATRQFELDPQTLKGLIDRTSFAMAQQDVRYFLNGMLLEAQGGKVRTVATDGHRLALSEMAATGDTDEGAQVIVPRKGVQELQKLLGEEGDTLAIKLGESHLCAEIGAFRLTTKLVDGKFPEYERVIPRDGDKIVLADTLELRQALNRTAILSNEKFKGIRVALSSGNLQVSANNPEQEEAEETVSVDYTGDSVEIGFNVGYLIDVLSVLTSEKVKITLLDANSSALLEDPESDQSVYVVMPMKL
jgi:DNA polymerase-3 subunit beta